MGLIARAIDREIEFRSYNTQFETLAAYMPRFVRRYMLRWHNSHHCDLGSHYTWKPSHWVCDSNDVPVLDGCYQCDPPGRPICWECGTPIILLPGFPDDECLRCHRDLLSEIAHWESIAVTENAATAA